MVAEKVINLYQEEEAEAFEEARRAVEQTIIDRVSDERIKDGRKPNVSDAMVIRELAEAYLGRDPMGEWMDGHNE